MHALCFVTANYMQIELKMTGMVSILKHFHASHFYGEMFVVFFRVMLSAKYILQRKKAEKKRW